VRHIVGRLPLCTKDFDRHAGWMALAVAGSGVPAEHWREQVGDLLLALGWRTDRAPYSPPPPKVRRSSSWKTWLAQPAPAGG
jgi:hypothetical protein